MRVVLAIAAILIAAVPVVGCQQVADSDHAAEPQESYFVDAKVHSDELGRSEVNAMSAFDSRGRIWVDATRGGFLWDGVNRSRLARGPDFPGHPIGFAGEPCRGFWKFTPQVDAHTEQYGLVDCVDGRVIKRGDVPADEMYVAATSERCDLALIRTAKTEQVKVGNVAVFDYDNSSVSVVELASLRTRADLAKHFRSRVIGVGLSDTAGRCLAYAVVQGPWTGKMHSPGLPKFQPIEIEEVDLGSGGRRVVARVAGDRDRPVLKVGFATPVIVSPSGSHVVLVTTRGAIETVGKDRATSFEIVDLRTGRTVREFPATGLVTAYRSGMVWLDDRRIGYVAATELMVGDIETGVVSRIMTPRAAEGCGPKGCGEVQEIRFSRETGLLAARLSEGVWFARVSNAP